MERAYQAVQELHLLPPTEPSLGCDRDDWVIEEEYEGMGEAPEYDMVLGDDGYVTLTRVSSPNSSPSKTTRCSLTSFSQTSGSTVNTSRHQSTTVFNSTSQRSYHIILNNMSKKIVHAGIHTGESDVPSNMPDPRAACAAFPTMVTYTRNTLVRMIVSLLKSSNVTVELYGPEELLALEAPDVVHFPDVQAVAGRLLCSVADKTVPAAVTEALG